MLRDVRSSVHVGRDSDEGDGSGWGWVFRVERARDEIWPQIRKPKMRKRARGKERLYTFLMVWKVNQRSCPCHCVD